MKIFLSLAVIINIFAIVVLSTGIFKIFEKPKSKSIFGYFVAGSLLSLLLALGFIFLFQLIFKHSVNWVYLLCIISPFVIGRLVKFDTLKKYTIIQILFFILSLSELIRQII